MLRGRYIRYSSILTIFLYLGNFPEKSSSRIRSIILQSIIFKRTLKNLSYHSERFIIHSLMMGAHDLNIKKIFSRLQVYYEFRGYPSISSVELSECSYTFFISNGDLREVKRESLAKRIFLLPRTT